MKINLEKKNIKERDLESGDILKLRYCENQDDEEDFLVVFIQNNRDDYGSYFLYLDDMSITQLDEFVSFDKKFNTSSKPNFEAIDFLLQSDSFNCELIEVIPSDQIEIRRI